MRALEVFGAALRLGLTSFGGPAAHLGYFRDEYVRRRGWLDDRAYAQLVALCQLLPGPASSELGIAIGVMRAGLPGGLLAWAAFTLPSAIAMVAFACVTSALGPADLRWLRGLQVVAVAIVAQAVWTMGNSLAPDRPRLAIALGAAVAALAAPGAAGQVGTIAAGGVAGALLLLVTPAKVFSGIVPWLLLFATVLFAAGPAIARRAQAASASGHGLARWREPGLMAVAI
ncbi:MAG TPA: chromate transporter, partial [Candidatus Eisenbacteria bacterium]|nr:chromate transporter [Candidatus Eisenbacteria bacterium]